MKKITMLFAGILLFGSMAFSQNLNLNYKGFALSPYATAGISLESAMGTNNPDYTVGVGMEANNPKYLIDTHVSADTADFTLATVNTGIHDEVSYRHHHPICPSLVSGANTNLTLQVSGYYKISTGTFKHFMAGAGATLNTNTTSNAALKAAGYNREGLQPFVGGGYELRSLRALATYTLPGMDAQHGNRLVNLTAEYVLRPHVLITQNVAINSYRNGSNNRVTGTQLGAGIKYRF